ncbi:hypothetical protein BDN70DRAFT_358086 [Pholiota conissans]|uniref:Secreted protein n=1 Tax=Pholiota conissans TaxID=109636 RepID=A0A9P5ZBP6_9AGAR|nr:hypothetical protein BDN70DRAFT_358086 [Pholiota conissans]
MHIAGRNTSRSFLFCLAAFIMATIDLHCSGITRASLPHFFPCIRQLRKNGAALCSAYLPTIGVMDATFMKTCRLKISFDAWHVAKISARKLHLWGFHFPVGTGLIFPSSVTLHFVRKM